MPRIPIEHIPVARLPAKPPSRPWPAPGGGSAPQVRPLSRQVLQQLGAAEIRAAPFTLTPAEPSAKTTTGWLAFHDVRIADAFENFAFLDAYKTLFVCISGEGRFVIQCKVQASTESAMFNVTDGAPAPEAANVLATVEVTVGKDLLTVVELPASGEVRYIGITCESGSFTFYSCQVTPLGAA
jgi:hypothetical protein